ncbi:MAG: YraN family protein, partial [Clostridia bacterium]|nr:YraN family protein [Clostridia bacterium]
RDNGWTVVGANYELYGRAELDLVAVKDDTVAFVEVKTRTREGLFPPSEAVGREKEKNLAAAAQSFLNNSVAGELIRPGMEVRFDIIEIILLSLREGSVNHIKNAFTADVFVPEPDGGRE